MVNLENKEKIFSVTEVTYGIKQVLETKYPSLSIKGEVTNFRRQASGHLYFTLKDTHSQISIVMFRSAAVKLTQLPKEGDTIIVEGSLTVYPPRGNYQVIVTTLRHSGVGDLLLLLHHRMQALKEKGYFLKEHKRPLPSMPKKIGMITSPTGSVIQDMLHVLMRRRKAFHVVLYPIKVQGAGAEKEIALAIRELNQYQLVDVIILARGGGSLEDLWPFNEECVAQAIFDSTIPIISGVGHETDTSIADYVADMRAPTPSAAAEIVSKQSQAVLDQFLHIQLQICNQIRHHIHKKQNRLQTLQKNPYLAYPQRILAKPTQSLDDATTKLKQCMQHTLHLKGLHLHSMQQKMAPLNPHRTIQRKQQQLMQIKRNLFYAFQEKVKNKKTKFSMLISHLQSLDPKNILKKGYCIPFQENSSSVIMDPNTLQENQLIDLLFYQGEVKTSVKEVKAKHEY